MSNLISFTETFISCEKINLMQKPDTKYFIFLEHLYGYLSLSMSKNKYLSLSMPEIR